jgi:hypothetical protein
LRFANYFLVQRKTVPADSDIQNAVQMPPGSDAGVWGRRGYPARRHLFQILEKPIAGGIATLRGVNSFADFIAKENLMETSGGCGGCIESKGDNHES